VRPFIGRPSFPETFCLKNIEASPISATGWGVYTPCAVRWRKNVKVKDPMIIFVPLATAL